MRVFKVVKIIALVLVAACVMGFVVMHLWNWLMPELFGLRVISFWQAIGLLLLSKLLLGGFHKHGPYRQGAWKRRMAARWEGMSPEERERFRAGMKRRGPCGFGSKDERAEQAAQ